MSSNILETYVKMFNIDTIVVKDGGIEMYEDGDFLKAVVWRNETVEQLKEIFPTLKITSSENELRSLSKEFENGVLQ